MGSQSKNSKEIKSSNGQSDQDVIDAAIRCFLRYGASRTSMGDIAEEAGISRKTLYRMFEDRSELINRVLSQVLNTMGKKVERKLNSYSDVRDAIIGGSIDSVKIGMKDKLFEDIVRNHMSYRIEQFLIFGNKKIREDMLRIWSPIIERGRKEGIIRSDLSNERVTELIQNVHALLLMRRGVSVARQRTFVKNLLWAALTNSNVD